MRLKTITQFLFVVGLNTSCGIFGIHKDNVNPNPDYQTEKLKEIGTRPAAIKHDSLIRQINSASTAIPSDIGESTLIIETYSYHDYLKIYENKYHIPKDNKQERRYFKRYEKKKKSLIKDPKYKIVYLDKEEYSNLDVNNYKYVLRTSNRIDYDPNQIFITNDGFVYPFISTLIYYIQDRQTDKVFREIKDLSILSKKKND
jgi:hypothetical protein